MLFYAITDRHLADPVGGLEQLIARFPELWVQLREKDLPAKALFDLGLALLRRIDRSRLLINDRVDVARALSVGVQLPQGAIGIAEARKILGAAPIGVSCHSPAECDAASKAGADLVTLSPIWPSPGKGTAIGASALTEAKAIMSGPTKLIALGGIDERSAGQAIAAGADGVAGIRWAWTTTTT